MIAAAAVATAGLAGARPAAAHTSLLGTTPKDDATVSKPLEKVELRFNDEIQAKYTSVAVTDPDGDKVNDGKPEVDGRVVEQPVEALRTAGTYRVGWRVVSADGHPVSGKLTFTVTEDALAPSQSTTASPSPSASTPAADATQAASRQPADDRSFVERHAAHLLIGAVIVLVGVAVVVWERRRRHD